jgi:hypothetical protein
VQGVAERFWDMFIVDALIGNSDRNYTNWGILLDSAGKYSLAPVYDNGRAFGERFMIQEFGLSIDSLLTKEAQANYQCNYLDDAENHIKPFEFIAQHSNTECDKALARFAQNFDMGKIETLIANTPNQLNGTQVMTDADKSLFVELIKTKAALLIR